MDISKYIAELLYEHDCVIIPGFGGFVCNYQPAEIHPVLNTISPPSKAISFNKNLRNNDGLLLNHIAQREGILFDEAFVTVYAWVGSSNGLIQRGEEVILKKIGTLHNDIEGNLQFTPENSVNYLKSSFGLRTITAEPIVRGKVISAPEWSEPVKTPVKISGRTWRIAAAVLLFAMLATTIQFMRSGIEIKSLHLDEAGVLHFINSVFKPSEPELEPIPTETSTPHIETSIVNEEKKSVAETIAQPQHNYYIIIGAFAKKRNADAAFEMLKQRCPDKIFVQKGEKLTRVGYSVGSNSQKAQEQLELAKHENASYWLLEM